MNPLQIPEPINCACKSCQAMCLNSPCFPIPADVKKLVMMGFGGVLEKTVWFDVVKGEIHGLVAPKSVKQGKYPNKCVLLTDEGLCAIHNTGLKPTEGKANHHSFSPKQFRETRQRICRTWITPEGKEVLSALRVLFDEEQALSEKFGINFSNPLK